MNWKPNKWGAALLSFLAPPLGMLYVNRPRLAGVYLIVLLTAGLSQFWLDAIGIMTPLVFVLIIVAIIHTYRIAARTVESNSRPWFSRWYGLITIAFAALVTITLFRAFFFEPFHLPSQSMFPSLPKGSYVVVRKFGYGNYATYGMHLFRGNITAPLNRGDVIVFEYPRDRSISYVKRLVGLPGDHIEYKTGRLYVNSTPLPITPLGSSGEFQIARESTYQIATVCNTPQLPVDITVEPGHLFVLGDNRDYSNDSRHWGQVPDDHVVGKVVLVLKNSDTQPVIAADLAPVAHTR